MANIGVRYVYFKPSGAEASISLGRASSVSLNMQRTKMSQLQNYRYRTDGANVSIQTDGYPSDAFNKVGTLYWCIVTMNNGSISYKCKSLTNTILYPPDISVAGITDTISFSTYTINGYSRQKAEAYTRNATSAENAKELNQQGW